jgi:hypothetical protein
LIACGRVKYEKLRAYPRKLLVSSKHPAPFSFSRTRNDKPSMVLRFGTDVSETLDRIGGVVQALVDKLATGLVKPASP